MLKNRGNQCILLFVSLIGIVCVYMKWELLGFSNAEVFGHVWSQSWRFQDFPEGLFGTDQTIGTNTFPLIDPLPTLIVNVLTVFLSLSLAYNILFVLSLVLSALAIRAMPVGSSEDHSVDLPLILLMFASPIVWGSLNSGLTEDWGIFFPILAIVSINRNNIVQAGVLTAVAAYWGLVLGWMSAILVSMYAIVHSVSRRELLKMWIVMCVCVLPLIGLHWDRLWLEGHRSVYPPSQFEPMWALNPWHHTDFASLWWVGPIDFSSQIIRLHPASLGLAAILSSTGCRNWKWWGLFLMCVGFAVGPEVYWMGYATGIPNPAHWILTWIPGSSLLNHHGRWMLMAIICWIVIVVQGMKKFNIVHWMTPIVVIEWFFMTPMGMPLMGTKHIKTSDVLNEMVDIGIPESTRLLRIPVRGPGVVFQQALYEQTVHGLPLWMNPNRPNPSEWFTLTEQSQWIETIAFTNKLPMRPCVPISVGAVLVADPHIELFVESWGKPIVRDDGYAFWNELPTCNR